LNDQESCKFDNPSFRHICIANCTVGRWLLVLCVYRDVLSLEEHCIIITEKELREAYYETLTRMHVLIHNAQLVRHVPRSLSRVL